ncbi:MAG: Bor family protein [Pseudobdellovibrionaceae bacterium]|nr:Bor family protein [Pseudobdellovibrionaceae bacterium]
MKTRVLSALVLAASLSTGCITATIRPQGGAPTAKEPKYSQRESFFMWGLAPDARIVNVKNVCGDKDPVQLQTQQTFVDGLLGGITLGIYSPRTAKVWCED